MCRLIVNNTVINEPIENILKDLKDEIHNGKLGKIKSRNGDNIQLTCPVHSGGKESNPSCGIYLGEDTDKLHYGDFHCFTCGASGPFYKFVAACFNSGDDYAKKWLIDNYGSEQINPLFDLPELDLNATKNKKSYLNPSILDGFEKWHPYMEKRKINKHIAEIFQLRYDPKTECIVFPVYDTSNKLLMLTRRSVNNKTFIIDKEKEKPVYLLNYIQNNNIKEAVVCESQINALYSFSLGYPAIATFGRNITSKQFQLLNKSGILHYYLAFDGDIWGDLGNIRFLKNIRKDVLVDVMILPQGKDLNDLSEEEVQNLKIMPGQEWLEEKLKDPQIIQQLKQTIKK